MENGFPLGLMENAAYTQIERPLRAGDRVLLYTDGLVEAANAAEELFELDRVKQALAAGTSLSPDAFLDRLLAELDHWSGQPAGDDLTVVMIDRL
jgi:serine phosphatase RsbU (regulator of sigma subunit)